MSQPQPRVAIVDYGMGNLFSVQQACRAAGLDAVLTMSPAEVRAADGVVLPGTGAFEGAIRTLREHGLVAAIQSVASAGRPLVGVCLGMQLMMEESQEFGRHEGLGLFKGTVVPFLPRSADGHQWKIPQVGWNRVTLQRHAPAGQWETGGLRDGDFMYFVHSFYVEPTDASTVVATARYGGETFCASLRRDNILTWQFHPERSASRGLALYQTFADKVRGYKETQL